MRKYANTAQADTPHPSPEAAGTQSHISFCGSVALCFWDSMTVNSLEKFNESVFAKKQIIVKLGVGKQLRGKTLTGFPNHCFLSVSRTLRERVKLYLQ